MSSPSLGMDRRAAWPDWFEDRVLFEDEDLLVVDKPAGVPCQPTGADPADDVAARLRRFLAARDGMRVDEVYLGTHQLLDQECSGVLIYTKKRKANAPLAKQLEGKGSRRTYVVAVDGWELGAGEHVLRHEYVRDRTGTVEIVEQPGRGHRGRRGGGESVVSRARALEQQGSRALLEVLLERGRVPGLRAQLAHLGAPIAGDRIFEGSDTAPCLMLHAARLSVGHPTTGAELSIEAPVPDVMRDWIATAPLCPRTVRTTLACAAHRRWGVARATESPHPTTAFRWFHGAGEGMPDMAVDVYGAFAVVHTYGVDAPEHEGMIFDAVAELGFEGVYVKRHPRQANELAEDERHELAPSQPVRGVPAPPELIIQEHGVPYGVVLGDGLSTGIFLDQRANRLRLREGAAGTDVLNLFAYTCAFSVAAASGGARRTVNVDASAPALERGQRNLSRVGRGEHDFVHGDVFDELARLATRRERFGWVVCDPPTYSSTRRSRWRSGKEWIALGAAAMRCAAPGGRLLLSSNDWRLQPARFRRYVHEAARTARRQIVKLRELPTPADFPPAPGRPPHLKGLLVTLR